jgi:glutaminyl-tRNA synthetase
MTDSGPVHTAESTVPGDAPRPADFIRAIVAEDLASGKHRRVVTRFPPEPNGYLHIGHAKSICLNFGVAEENPDGYCYMRFDDTNPAKESVEYMEAIKQDVRWLGFDWGDRLRHASDYFQQLYDWAVDLIRQDKAYVDSLSGDEIRAHRGTLTEPGRDSPHRNRPVAESLDLFERMRQGEFEDGAHVLRAKIDMTSPNLNMRDPIVYRIRKHTHHMTGDTWCLYPMYDFTQCLSDAIEGVTHSLCTLEFEDHRPLYDWYLDHLEVPARPRQIEFARLNLTYTVMSKRRLNELVVSEHVSGWDDPRMPTLSGMRRRGYTPEAIRDFCDRIGITKKDAVIDVGLLETCVREDLDRRTRRVLAVLKPLKVVIENYPEGQSEEIDAPYHPRNAEMGSRRLSFSREILIDRDDFMEDPPRKFFRLAPDREVRLRYGYIIRCTGVIKDPASGEVVELRCSYDPETRSGAAQGGRKVKGTIHWVSSAHALPVEVRLYDRLFSVPDPGGDKTRDFKTCINPDSVQVLSDARVEASLTDARPGDRYQFERQGYFCADRPEAESGRPVFNRTVTLRDSWAKIGKQPPR